VYCEERFLTRNSAFTDKYTSFGLTAGARDDHRQAVLWFAHAARLAGHDKEWAEANRIRAGAWGRQALQPVRALVHPAERARRTWPTIPAAGSCLRTAYAHRSTLFNGRNRWTFCGGQPAPGDNLSRSASHLTFSDRVWLGGALY
jgi:hypothetical protein